MKHRVYKRVKLSEAANINPPKSEIKDKKDIEVSFLPMSDLGVGAKYFFSKEKRQLREVYSGYTYFKDDDVLVAKVTPCFENGKAGIAKDLVNSIGFGSSEYFVLRPKEGVLSDYLYYNIIQQDFLKQGSENMSGAVGLKRVTKEFLYNYEIALPLPTEQLRIVQKLDRLFEKIDRSIKLVEENLEIADKLMGSVLEAAFENKKNNWVYAPLKKVTLKIGSGSTPSGGGNSYKQTGISLIRSMNVHDNQFSTKGLAFIDDIQANKLSNVTVESCDVLLNITGASVARCCIVPDKVLPARVNQHVSILRPDKSLLSSFLAYYLVSPKTKEKLLFDAGGGATREAITKNMLEKFEVPVPKTRDEQQQIVDHIDNFHKKQLSLISYFTTRLTQLRELKSSILESAFRGEL